MKRKRNQQKISHTNTHKLKNHRKLNVIDAWVCRLDDGDCWMFVLLEAKRFDVAAVLSLLISSVTHSLSLYLLRCMHVCARAIFVDTILTDPLTFIHKWTRKQFVSDYIDQNWIHGNDNALHMHTHTYISGYSLVWPQHTIPNMVFRQQFTLLNAFSS